MLSRTDDILTPSLVKNPLIVRREINKRSFYEFLKFFWPVISNDKFVDNWHIRYLCNELQILAEHVISNKPRPYDLIINVPPGTSKTTICSIMFPVWCWVRAYVLKLITVSYSSTLSLESAELSRDLIRSDLFKTIYPELDIKEDKDTKGNYKVISKESSKIGQVQREKPGGNRFSTSVGGTLTGFHGHIIIVDDPLDPRRAASVAELKKANYWIDSTLVTRKVDKLVSPIILIMQRLAVNDTTAHLLSKFEKVKHICLPGEIKHFANQVRPKELISYYQNGLLDVKRMSWEVLRDMEVQMGQYSYAAQIGQSPSLVGGGMFKIDHVQIIDKVEEGLIVKEVRYWDKAGTKDGGAYTVGVKMAKLSNGRFVIMDVKRGRWSSEEREKIIKETAFADGFNVPVLIEQEPGSGGKESAENTIRNLAGFVVEADRPVGDKTMRADPFSVQVNSGNVWIVKGDWNLAYLDELKSFPTGTYKDQVDASSGCFSFLVAKKEVRRIV